MATGALAGAGESRASICPRRFSSEFRTRAESLTREIRFDTSCAVLLELEPPT